ncbi:MAG: ribosome silencing factor [Actinomycetota bacterium]|nr:ribosome silencing factor [Actinomycetota bacterium]
MIESLLYAVDAARAADEKKALDIRIMDMREALGITDYFVITSGKTQRQTRRIQERIEEKLGEKGLHPVSREGERDGRWIILDYMDFVVHVFLDEARSFYNLEHLWQDVPFVEWRKS